MASTTSDAPREQSQPPPAERAFGIAFFAAVMVGCAVAGYAFFSPAVYRTSSVVLIEPVQAKDASALGPLEASRKLHEAVLDREALERLAKEQAPSATTEAHIQIARSIQNGFQIDSVDGRSFTISVRDADRSRVAERCNWLAARAVARGPEVLAPEPVAALADDAAARQKRVGELMTFLAQHPEILGDGTEKRAAPTTKVLSDADLRAERDQIQKRLAKGATDASSDNPYADRAPSEQVTQLVQRLAQINAKLAHGSVLAKPSKAAASPAVAAEWQRLTSAVTEGRAVETPKPSTPLFTARVLSPAVVPTWPLEPDRKQLLAWGALGALGVFAATWFGLRSQRGLSGGGLSSYPPPGGFATTTSSGPPPDDADLSSRLLAAPGLEPRLLALSPASPPMPAAASASALRRAPGFEEPAGPPAPRPIAALPSLTRTFVLRGPIELPAPPTPPHEETSPPRPESVFPPATDPWPATLTLEGPGLAPRAGSASETIKTSYSSAPPADLSPPKHTSSGPPRSVAPRSERSLRAAVEVNVEVSATNHVSSKPPAAPRTSPARTTQVLGSPIQPIIAPGSRRTPAAGPPLGRSSPAPLNTSYSYVSTPPPRPPKGTSSAPPSAQDSNVVAHAALPGWRPDLSLLPEARRGLVREICPVLPEECVVIAVFGQTRAADAKSRLAAELALALADSGHLRVLLLEGDLQHPSVQRFMRMGMPEREGFSDQLRTRIDLHVKRPWAVVECSASLHVLAEGLNRAPELVLSRPFEDCIRELRAFYDFIIIDGPLLSDVPSCRAIHDVMDNAVLVRVEGASVELSRVNELFPGKPISVVPVTR
jgi:Mrp family chromosome partitioning ATPase